MCKHNTQVNEGLQITAEHGHGEHRAESAGGCDECDQATDSHGVGGAPGPADRTNVKAQKVMWDKKEGDESKSSGLCGSGVLGVSVCAL